MGYAGWTRTPQEPKRSAWWDRKDLKWYKNNVVMVGLTISMHFRQLEDLKFLFFPEEHAPRTPQKPLQSVQPSRIWRHCPNFTWESRIPTRLQSGHEYPNFEERLSQAHEQRIIFLLNYHKICLKINKLLNLDIKANAELQSRWITHARNTK